jgi:hypothetical protein
VCIGGIFWSCHTYHEAILVQSLCYHSLVLGSFSKHLHPFIYPHVRNIAKSNFSECSFSRLALLLGHFDFGLEYYPPFSLYIYRWKYWVIHYSDYISNGLLVSCNKKPWNLMGMKCSTHLSDVNINIYFTYQPFQRVPHAHHWIWNLSQYM